MARSWLVFVAAMTSAACSDIAPNHDTEEWCGCVSESISLTTLAPPLPTITTVAPCRAFSFSIAEIADRPASMCTQPLACPGAPTGPTGRTVAEAAAHPDVQQALRDGPVFYGLPSPDGTGTFRVRVGQAAFEMGLPCDATPDCTPVPDGLSQFVAVLLAARDHELRRSPCREWHMGRGPHGGG